MWYRRSVIMLHLRHSILCDTPNVLKFMKLVSLARSQGSGAYVRSSGSVTQLRGCVRDLKNTLETMGDRLTLLASTLLPFHISLPTGMALRK
jgi:hypothetical protein